jgi:hypothetical protein
VRGLTTARRLPINAGIASDAVGKPGFQRVVTMYRNDDDLALACFRVDVVVALDPFEAPSG